MEFETLNRCESRQNWEGLHSNKFHHKQKKHYAIDAVSETIKRNQKRHFSPRSSGENELKPLIKIFPDISNVQSPTKHAKIWDGFIFPKSTTESKIKRKAVYLQKQSVGLIASNENMKLLNLQLASGSLNNIPGSRTRAVSSEALPFASLTTKSYGGMLSPLISPNSLLPTRHATKFYSTMYSTSGGYGFPAGNNSTTARDRMSRGLFETNMNFNKPNDANDVMINMDIHTPRNGKLNHKVIENLQAIREDEDSVKKLDDWEKIMLKPVLVSENDEKAITSQKKSPIKLEKKPKVVQIYEYLQAKKMKRKQTYEISPTNGLALNKIT